MESLDLSFDNGNCNLAQFDQLYDWQADLDNMDFDECHEVYQWFLAPELVHHLAQRGEIVLNGEYWGRTCCGQSINLDTVIQKLAFDLNWD